MFHLQVSNLDNFNFFRKMVVCEKYLDRTVRQINRIVNLTVHMEFDNTSAFNKGSNDVNYFIKTDGIYFIEIDNTEIGKNESNQR